MIRVVLIGVSGYGEFYLSQLLRLSKEGKVQLLGAVVRSLTADSQAKEHVQSQVEQVEGVGGKVFLTPDDMYDALGRDIDLCCIPTGLSSHAALTMQALEHGCHVLVEKPAAVTVQDIDAMRKLAQKADKKVMVGFQNIYDEDIQYLKRRLLSGELGKVQTIKMSGLWKRGSDYFSRNSWTGKLNFEGEWVLDSPANNAFAHYINLLCFLGGSSFKESAKLSSIQAELYRAMPIESCDTAFVKVKTSTDISLQYYVTHACAGNEDPRIEIKGSEGMITWSGADTERVNRSRVMMFDTVIDHLEGAGVLVCDLNIAYALTHCINAMHVAAHIEDVPESEYSIQQTDYGEQVVINRIDAVIHEAYEQECLPGEFNVSWARASEEMDCSNLNVFNGPIS